MKIPHNDSPSEIDIELRELAGSPEAYSRVMENLATQMSEIAKTRGKINLKPGAKLFKPDVIVHKSLSGVVTATKGVAQQAGAGTVAKPTSKLKRRARERS